MTVRDKLRQLSDKFVAESIKELIGYAMRGISADSALRSSMASMMHSVSEELATTFIAGGYAAMVELGVGPEAEIVALPDAAAREWGFLPPKEELS